MTDQTTPTPRTDAAQIEREDYEEATQECDRIALPERPKDAWELCRELERELAAERALADRLANALDDIAFGTIIRRESGGCGQSLMCTPEQLQNYAHRALAAWKEARRGTD